MPVTVVLAVGVDPWLIAAQDRIWSSAGYFVVSADSLEDAINLFYDGDFDIVVVGHCISVENRERLTSLIRASGSKTPVAFIGNSSHDSGWFEGSTLKNDSGTLLAWLTELMADKAEIRQMPTNLHGNGSRR